ncbi:MAG: HldE-like bifunctional protein [Acidimicrobiales bacterium]|nr:HldE-like bifunctional protein [Acidimicrobiales bacterium]
MTRSLAPVPVGGPDPGEGVLVLQDCFDEHVALAAASVDAVVPDLGRAVARSVTCLASGGKVLTMGNGGSGTQAQHFAAELTGRFEAERRALPAVALSVDQAAITAIANDYGYEEVFSRQLEALARPGDLVVAISTSGSSPNVVAAVRQARRLGCHTVGLTGDGGGALHGLVDILVAVPSTRVARVQEIHTLCLHAWCAALDRWAVGELPGGAT